MRTNEEIEDLLIGTGLPFERLDDAMWVVVNDADRGENLVVYKTAALVAFRMKVFELPASPPPGLLRRLLELNAASMVHGAYGVEGGSVVMVDALEAENLDANELVAVIDSFGLALSAHRDELAGFLA